MTTLIAVYNRKGWIGRCDARCYNGTDPRARCTCICGGKNHGVGLKQAMVNTAEIPTSALHEWAQKRVGTDGAYQIRRDGNLYPVE